jgi:hypothetical protein
MKLVRNRRGGRGILLISTIPLLPLVTFPPENINYSASFTLTKKAPLFMKAKNIVKVTYLPGIQLCI